MVDFEKLLKKEKSEKKRKIVEVSIEDLIETAQGQILESYGGFGMNDIVRVSGLKFSIPDITEEGKCNEVQPVVEEAEGGEGGCGETGGSCICGEPENHEGDHVCKLCGEKW